MNNIDLHIHSIFSDGSYLPKEIIEMSNNLSAISITDHDNIDAYAEIYSKDNIEINIIPGIELTVFCPFEIHILGYFIDIESDNLKKDLIKINLHRKKNIFKICNDLLKKNYINLSLHQVREKYKNITLDNIISEIKIKNKDFEVKEFFESKDFLNNSNIGLSIEEGIGLIKKYGGISFLAHPKKIVNEHNHIDIFQFILKLKNYGLNGVECYHESHFDSDIDLFLKFSYNNGLLVSGGSDFHGYSKPDVTLGIGKGNLNISFELLKNIKSRIKK